jgi:hypothetical protein
MSKLILLCFLLSFLAQPSSASIRFNVAAKITNQSMGQNILVQGAVWQCSNEELPFCNSICNNSDCFLPNANMENIYGTNSQSLRVIFSRSALYVKPQEESSLSDISEFLKRPILYLNAQSFLNFYTNRSEPQSQRNFDQFCADGNKGTFLATISDNLSSQTKNVTPQYVICTDMNLEIKEIKKLKFLLIKKQN